MSSTPVRTPQTVKFQFERVLSKGAVVQQRREPKKTRWNEKEVDAIRAEAHAAGVESGRKSVEAEAARQVAEHAAALTAAVSALTQTLEAERGALRNDAALIALAIARKLAPALMAAAPVREIEALTADALALLRDEPRVEVRVAPDHAASLAPQLRAIADEQGFGGALAISADDDMPPGDARIAWAKGEIVRDTVALEARVGEIVRAYLEAPADVPAQTDLFSLLGTNA